jgi:hypothetical protein
MFVTELDLLALRGKRWRLLANLEYRDRDDQYCVPAGFVTDLGSLPRWFRWAPYSGFTGRSSRSAVLLDFLYSQVRMGAVTKADADSIFRRALAAEGLSRGTCTLYYYSVRWFGNLR